MFSKNILKIMLHDIESGIVPVNLNNLDFFKILVTNSLRMGHDNNNIEIASITPGLWMGQFLDKNYDKITYVSKNTNFHILKFESGEIYSKSYATTNLDLNSDEELDNFMNSGKWKKLVLFSICKYIDLKTMKTSYKLRYADITEKYEVIDNKINNILEK